VIDDSHTKVLQLDLEARFPSPENRGKYHLTNKTGCGVMFAFFVPQILLIY
jgi:hypothetical protein